MMNRRGFIGILGGAIAGAAIAPKAFAETLKWPTTKVLAGNGGAFAGYEAIAHVALDLLDKALETKKRLAIKEGWMAARVGDTVMTEKRFVKFDSITGTTFRYSYRELFGGGADRDRFIERVLKPHIGAMASDLDWQINGLNLVTCPLELPGGVEAAIAVTKHDIAMRMLASYDIVENNMFMRFDSLFGRYA